MVKKAVHIEIRDEIGWVILNQPNRYNAINFEMIDLLEEGIARLKNDESVKALVITGAGEKAFCSGGDLSAFHQLHSEQEAYSMLSRMGKVLLDLFQFPKPTVALLNGVAVGGGCEIATACDIRIASDHVKFGFIQGSLGITTGWGGTTFLMERVPKDAAFELLIRANKIPVTTGLQIGFIQQVFAKETIQEDFQNWIRPMLKNTRGVLEAYKQRRLDQIDYKTIKKRMNQEISECSRLWASDEHHQAVAAFLKRQ
ncbi:enoyl-CoA hydratase/isomerase family protein [Pseudalkalibacillus berkeleyi]|uniref:Ethylmalonyl-CoA decarboxylase n=1 Tax=Pseudalkalibacillus berkeleyi TaxID=1069813 RepID=A0ABS9GYV3_9BACL|nr:enoyl-CoA hydratase/isomerase family protein [Pseudalkalibacillus berkeleyi]MCF6136996.1 enoyl-CoA hydratase/isomerase family protein [Pseudalkalibacillus berkeleyi]